MAVEDALALSRALKKITQPTHLPAALRGAEPVRLLAEGLRGRERAVPAPKLR